MKTIRFTAHPHNRSYVCSEPGDQSGEYVRIETALMSNFFQEFKIATEEKCYCAFCGKQFEPGVAYKAIFTNDIPKCGGNPLCCRACFVDNGGSDAHMRELWKLRCEKWDEGYKGEWRWFQDHCHRAPHAANEAHWQHEVQATARDVRDEMRSRLEGER